MAVGGHVDVVQHYERSHTSHLAFTSVSSQTCTMHMVSAQHWIVLPTFSTSTAHATAYGMHSVLILTRGRRCCRVPSWGIPATGASCAVQIKRAGFAFPTPIQAQAWPIAMAGRDVVAIAKTGAPFVSRSRCPACSPIRMCLCFPLPALLH